MMKDLPEYWKKRKKALLDFLEQLLDESDGWSVTYSPTENFIRIDMPTPAQRKEFEDVVGSAFNDFLPRCANCYKQLGENALGRMAFPNKLFCSVKCAEEYSE